MKSGEIDRIYWVTIAARLAQPILHHLEKRTLKKALPPTSGREAVAPLEALARLLSGLAPWLELNEGESQGIGAQAREALKAATDPQSPDYMLFTQNRQALVDSAFLAVAILRAPTALWQKVEPRVQDQVIQALELARELETYETNWLLFSAILEVTLGKLGRPARSAPIEHALRRHEEWYKGDGAYGDGPSFHWDYYNSFVIHPMLLEIARHAEPAPGGEKLKELLLLRAQRYGEVLERLISPEGTFPPLGRSLTYRFGVLQLLGQLAWRGELPASLPPGQVRAAMTAVLKRQMEAPGTFDDGGWLQPGFCGAQPGLAEFYISRGSLYLCAAGLLPLGLAPSASFWSEPCQDWTARRLWSGQDGAADQALSD
jgi:hypothetical protein